MRKININSQEDRKSDHIVIKNNKLAIMEDVLKGLRKNKNEKMVRQKTPSCGIFSCYKACSKSKASNKVMSSSTAISSEEEYYLGPQAPEDIGKKTLILDVDETLVHSKFTFDPLLKSDFTCKIFYSGESADLCVMKRPFVDIFLEKMSKIYEIVFYTASIDSYARPLLDKLDKNNYGAARLYRNACVYHKGTYVKNLAKLGRDLKKTIIIDNSPAAYIFNPDNAIPIKSWFDNKEDRELLDLIPALETLSRVKDVQIAIKKVLALINGSKQSHNETIFNENFYLTKRLEDSPDKVPLEVQQKDNNQKIPYTHKPSSKSRNFSESTGRTSTTKAGSKDTPPLRLVVKTERIDVQRKSDNMSSSATTFKSSPQKSRRQHDTGDVVVEDENQQSVSESLFKKLVITPNKGNTDPSKFNINFEGVKHMELFIKYENNAEVIASIDGFNRKIEVKEKEDNEGYEDVHDMVQDIDETIKNIEDVKTIKEIRTVKRRDGGQAIQYVFGDS